MPDGTYPLFRRRKPQAQNVFDFSSDGTHIDFSAAHLSSYSGLAASDFAAMFDKRAAAAIASHSCYSHTISIFPSASTPGVLLESKNYTAFAGADPNDANLSSFFVPLARCLTVLAFSDFFPDAHAEHLHGRVSEAILLSRPGYCGTFGPGIDNTTDVITKKPSEGNYDISQMHLLAMAYRYFDELLPDARELLITVLLATGRIARPSEDDTVTSGGAPNDFTRAGYIVNPFDPEKLADPFDPRTPAGETIDIRETENHILTIHTARYLTNQLLFQRDLVEGKHDPQRDNRRNGSDDTWTCMNLMLYLLRNMLVADFSEYNAKPYQTSVRNALLNLYSFAYDHEVRLAARMVLDYLGARYATSSNDLRRLVPFRRRNEPDLDRVKVYSDGDGSNFCDMGLLEWALGADPGVERYAVQAGNLRIFETTSPQRTNAWSIAGQGEDAAFEAVSDYRLPTPILDLFVNDGHRRFYQRLHRTPYGDPDMTGRNCDNHEIYASSPSYLITAGGAPAPFAIDPGLADLEGDYSQELGVAVTTTFMPTGLQLPPDTEHRALPACIQCSSFSQSQRQVANYGVAPDFLCGHQVKFPQWYLNAIDYSAGDPEPPGAPNFQFADVSGGRDDRPGFYLAVLRYGNFTVIEAFDTWLHSGLKFVDFQASVYQRNGGLVADVIAQINQNGSTVTTAWEGEYTTHNGNRVFFNIWSDAADGHDGVNTGAEVRPIVYGNIDGADAVGDAGNNTTSFLSGTVLNSNEPGLIDIANWYLNANITLDMRDQAKPRRTSESGEVESAGSNEEVWVNFAWTGPISGDFFQPFTTLSAAVSAVASHGDIRITPGTSRERPLTIAKKLSLVAPAGGVTLGAR